MPYEGGRRGARVGTKARGRVTAVLEAVARREPNCPAIPVPGAKEGLQAHAYKPGKRGRGRGGEGNTAESLGTA